MTRKVRIAAAQLGAVHRFTPRSDVLKRMIKLLEEVAQQNAAVILFPEIAFTTFFPRYLITDEAELESFFEHGDITSAPRTAALFARARELSIDISVGFAEATDDGQHFNTSIYYHAKSGSIISKYRKIHLPGTFEPFANPDATNQLEKRYFLPGDLGFNTFRVPDLASSSEPIFGMMICNDRRWPEAWRSLGLQGAEVVLCGYNTAGFAPDLWGSDNKQSPEQAEADALFHHKLVMQSNSYMNATFSVCAARCGMDDGKYSLIGGSCIVNPEGNILAEAKTKEDEVVFAEIDLDACKQGKTKTFDFARHRRTEHYQRIVQQTGVTEPPSISTEVKHPLEKTKHQASNTSISEASPNKPADTQSPPKQIRILLINPNSTSSMTTSCLNSLTSSLPPDVHITPFTGTTNESPTAIESQVDAILSSAACFRSLLTHHPDLISTHEAILVACYSAHPLISMLREEFDLPVIGIMEASLLMSRTMGGSFGIVATGGRSAIAHVANVEHYGMTKFCAGIESCELGVLDLERFPREEVMRVLRDVSGRLIGKGAEALLLGCAGMTKMKSALEDVVREEGVQVVDGVVAGVQYLVGVVRMGGRTGKKGVWRSSRVGRERRGQTYI
ncbi:Putative carbon-nitrogen hydrolase, asp/Glu/hydantoin racemase [Septoria linicola]|uniref:Carbon-nitrogen hydrolase, asp/Glu/hydantoin racemase n=1 Tax=Septoria linicola TaxID=215465 RepID=A0A9Q9AQ65_9PEZI|nr:putative carbon-nitrogen hydrolase, asp/Glu/hydantoin racemase [Septoria linicola]USW50545.1 Putative carbon-nitrogen hydrolase, asp/Glu/hydantoin racemase [Septoria linicola]